MDRIKVNLLNITGIETAHSAVQKPYGKKVKNPAELLHKVAKVLKHHSVLEHIILQFEIDGSSRLELQEHMRHRLASPTVASTRYSMAKMVKELGELKNDYREIERFLYKYTVFPNWMLALKNTVDSFYLRALGSRIGQLMFFADVYKKHGADVAKYELIESLRTSFVWTINLRSMLNFLELRTATNAHFEIRQIANEMAKRLSDRGEVKDLL